MKKILILCSILLMVGCSQKEKSDIAYQGEYGTYEIINTRLIANSAMLREEYAQLQWKIKYTNTTSEPKKPNESIKLDLVLENETDVELNEVTFSQSIYTEGENPFTEEENELIENGWLNIKPGAIVEIIVGSTVEKEKIDSLYLRNRDEEDVNGKKFEKKIKIDDFDNVMGKVEMDKPLIVNVRANRDNWEFSYSDKEIVTINELVVPTNEIVRFNLLPSDFGHSFWIPSAGGKMDTNPNSVNEFWLEFDEKKADEPSGILYGKCAEHGTGMDFEVTAMSRTEFNEWIKEMLD